MSKIPLNVSGTAGQLSNSSRIPSPSVSNVGLSESIPSGQPSVSSIMLYVSGSNGQVSILSSIPSPSESIPRSYGGMSGQPSESSNLFHDSGSDGHASSAFGIPSLSASLRPLPSGIVSGQPSIS